MERCCVISSPIGNLKIVQGERGLRSVNACDEPATGPVAYIPASFQLIEYFSGTRQRFEIALDLEGTEFQRAVWDALFAIPFGSVASYGQIACTIGRPGAARAVGNAAGRNPAMIVVPCHRLIAAGGRLGGFSGGLWRKKALLAHEGVSWKENAGV